MMKKILVLTSVYPGAGAPSNFTPVVHYIVKEWVKMGYDVRVIHNCTFFPNLFYKAPLWLRRFLQNRGGRALPTNRLSEDVKYQYEGVTVYRVAMKKIVPMGKYTQKVLINSTKKITDYLSEEKFVPDVIIAHWANPQLYMLARLKNLYHAKTTLVMHDNGAKIKTLFANWHELKESVDIWGFRSRDIKQEFEELYGATKVSFRCFSGIPDYYFKDIPTRNGVSYNRFVQVGLLNEYKNPHKAINAIERAFDGKEYSFKLIGEGPLRKQLENQIHQLLSPERVELCGRLKREEVLKQLDQSDIFVLISNHEAFGLAYIEAMARGCIVIASSGGGMDGIIKNGFNGFLCEPGSEDSLYQVIRMIMSMSNEERKNISNEAIMTSQKLTEYLAAKDYIDTVISFSKFIGDYPSGTYHELLG